MDRNDIVQKISEWLSKEKDWTMYPNEHETNYEFGWKIVMMGGMGCNIGLERDIDRINIMGNGQLSSEDAKKYKLVPKDKILDRLENECTSTRSTNYTTP